MSNYRPPRSLLDGLSDVVGDLWGTPVPATPVKPQTAPAAVPVHTVQPALPPFEQLWKTADESIDWTEALASPTPTDGLTSPERWAMYHQHAAQVLRGDVAAYLAVLKAANPMADLMPYVATLDVSTQSADLLSASFTARGDLLSSNAKEYLAGMAVRIARDLFAVLPVTQVSVTARDGEKELLNVLFDRTELYKVRFAFIDPVDFVVRSGGVFSGD